ncbi:hypothetical protein TIFTF001_031620 [Ficus carica]|uniref:Uncharacterized protein n=1 Tax=Ficus carica TaxID=3494 RepID=A0AA88J6K3_FICCA|nr:hypothetical protein TIFTF001_031620 [Ficus carica]
MSAKNTGRERRSARVPSKPSSSSSAEERASKPIPGMERTVCESGLKRKQGEMGVNDSENLITSLESKISKDVEGQYVRLVPDREITRAKINTFVNITETCIPQHRDAPDESLSHG